MSLDNTSKAILPRDRWNNPIPLTEDKTVLNQTYNASLTTTSVETTLQATTTMLEIQAIGIDIALKYGTTAATTANFDEYIQDGHVRHYVLPAGTTAIETIAVSGTGTIVIIEK